MARRRSYGAISDKKLLLANLPLKNIVSPLKHDLSKSCNDIRDESVCDITFVSPFKETASSSNVANSNMTLPISPVNHQSIQSPGSDKL